MAVGTEYYRLKLYRGGAYVKTLGFYFLRTEGVVSAQVRREGPSVDIMNEAINTATGGAIEKILTGATCLRAGSTIYGDSGNGLLYSYKRTYTLGVDILDGDKLVFSNGSYMIFHFEVESRSGNTTNPSGAQFAINEINGKSYHGSNRGIVSYYTKDDEYVYGTNNLIEPESLGCSGDMQTYYGWFRGVYALLPWKTRAIGSGNYSLNQVGLTGQYRTTSLSAVPIPVIIGEVSPATTPPTMALGMKFFGDLVEDDPDDPYPDDDSGGGDEPDPDGIPDGDDIPIPPLPDVDITDTGFITLYRPSLTQVKNLANYMWSDLFSLDSFKKLFADPMDCILGFNVLPVIVPAGGASEVTVGNMSTGVAMTECASQWVAVDCGTVNIGTPYDTYLDYSPYTKYSIYLPYIGLQSLSADDVVGKPIHLVYHIDALSCSCVAYLLCGSSVLYQFAGSCGYSIPLTGDSFRNMVSSMINIATTVAGAVATGGITAPLAVSAGASVAQNVMNAKPEVKRSGSVGSSAGIMGVQTPYLILEIPRICKPKEQHKYLGYPSFITDYVGNVGGYSEWESVILSGVPCTDEERASIEEILKGGVYNV